MAHAPRFRRNGTAEAAYSRRLPPSTTAAVSSALSKILRILNPRFTNAALSLHFFTAPAMSPGGLHPSRRGPSTTLGWREWVQLPVLGVSSIKAKLDTGARTSAIHAFDLREFVQDGVETVRFEIHPVQRSSAASVQAEAVVVDRRAVRSSGGHAELRPVIMTTLRIGDAEWPIEVTLTRRDAMGFRMLLGRQALRGRAVVDPGRSYQAGGRSKRPSTSAASGEGA